MNFIVSAKKSYISSVTGVSSVKQRSAFLLPVSWGTESGELPEVEDVLLVPNAEYYCNVFITSSSAPVLPTQSILHSQVWCSLTLHEALSDLLVSLSFFCVFQLHLFTQLPCSEEGVRAGGPCCLGEWKADLQECAGRWRYPIPGAEWSQATFELCFHKR